MHKQRQEMVLYYAASQIPHTHSCTIPVCAVFIVRVPLHVIEVFRGTTIWRQRYAHCQTKSLFSFVACFSSYEG